MVLFGIVTQMPGKVQTQGEGAPDPGFLKEINKLSLAQSPG